MDRQSLIQFGIEWAAFVFKSERAVEMLSGQHTASGLSADDAQAVIDARAAFYKKRLLLAAVTMLGLGYAAKELLGGTAAGRLGVIVMYAGLCLAALQYRKTTNSPPLSIKAVTDAFRKK